MPKPLTAIFTDTDGTRTQHKITPDRVYWGATRQFPQPQWLLAALDHATDAHIDFPMAQLSFFSQEARNG